MPGVKHRENPDDDFCPSPCRCKFFLGVVLVLVTSLTIFLSYNPIPSTNTPLFGVESAMVSIDHINNTAAEWGLEVFAENPNKKFNFNYRQLDVYFQSVSQDWILAANVGSFRQGSENTTLVNANVKTLLPPCYRGGYGMVWDLSVMFRAKINHDEVIQACCRNMKVAFVQNATTGLLLGSRISCPLEMSSKYV